MRYCSKKALAHVAQQKACASTILLLLTMILITSHFYNLDITGTWAKTPTVVKHCQSSSNGGNILLQHLRRRQSSKSMSVTSLDHFNACIFALGNTGPGDASVEWMARADEKYEKHCPIQYLHLTLSFFWIITWSARTISLHYYDNNSIRSLARQFLYTTKGIWPLGEISGWA